MKVDFKKRKVYFHNGWVSDEDFIMEFAFTPLPANPNAVIRPEDIRYFQDKLYESLAVPKEWFGK